MIMITVWMNNPTATQLFDSKQKFVIGLVGCGTFLLIDFILSYWTLNVLKLSMDVSYNNASIIFNLRSQEDHASETREEISLHGSLLCLLYCNGKLGAAYYNCRDKTVIIFMS